MSSKTVPISVRLSHEDAEFLSSLKINGATTPSDKLRAIISENRQRHSKITDYQGCFQLIVKFMEPAVAAIRKAEMDQGVHSDIITRSFEWLPDVIAYLVSSLSKSESGEIGLQDLKDLEKGFSDRIFRVMESVLQLATTQWLHGYDPQSLEKRSKTFLDLAGLIRELQARKK